MGVRDRSKTKRIKSSQVPARAGRKSSPSAEGLKAAPSKPLRTESQRAGEDIAEQERIPSQNPSPVLRLRGDGLILYANEASQGLLAGWGRAVGEGAPKFWQNIASAALEEQATMIVETQSAERIFSFSVVPTTDANEVFLYGYDVTERKRAEKALTDSEMRFRIAAQSAADLIYDWDILNGTLQWFGSVDALLGYAPGEFPRTLKTWEGILHADDHDRVMAAVDRHLKNHVPYIEEYRVRRKDGTFGYWTGKGEALRDKNGSAYKMIGVCTDITERKKVEEELKEREGKLNTLFEVSPVGISILDSERNISFMNSALERILGITREGLFRGDHKNRTYIRPDGTKMPAEELASVRAVKEQRAVNNVETGVVKEDGSVVWTNVSAVPVAYPDWKVVIITSDITERKRAEEALQQSEKRFRELSSIASEGIMIHEGGVILDANFAFAELSGYSNPDDLLGKKGLEIIPFTSESQQRLLAHMRSGSTETYEIELVKPDGSILPAETHSKEITYRGRQARLVLMRDITERKRAEEGLKKSEQMIKGILDTSPVGITLTVGRKIKWVNDAWVRIFGFTNEREYIDQPTGILYPSEQDYEETRSRIYKHLQEAHIGELIAVMMRHDGTVFHASLQICEVDPSDPSKGTISIIADISQRVEAEEALRKSEEQYRSLTENINLGIYRNTPGHEGRFIEANPALIGMFGYKNKEEFLAISVSSLYQNPEDRNRFNDKILEEGFVRGEELWLKKKDGTLFIGSVSAVAVKDKQGHVEYYDGIIQDVTERKRAEGTLADSETRFRIAARSASDLIYDWDILNGTLQWFGSVDALLGYAPGEFPRTLKAWEGILHTDDHDRVMAAVDQHLKKHVPYFEEYRVRRQDGTFGYWTDKGEALWDEKGFAYKMIGVCTDITERKRMEEALREKEERYRQLVDNTDTGFVVIDDKGIVILANEPYQRIAGAKGAEDLIGHSVIEWTAPEEHENNAEAVALCARQGFIKDFETVYQHGDGRRVHLLINATVHESSAGGKNIVSFCRDITELKRTEEALRENERRLSSIYDTVGDVIFYLAVEAEGQYRFASVNSAFCRVTGLPQEAVFGKRVNEVIPEPSLSMVLRKYRQAIEEKAIVRWEETSDYPAGRLTGEVSIAPVFDEGGRCAHLVGSVHDITERKRAEEALKLAEVNYRTLTENSPDLIARFDKQLRHLYVNPAAAKAGRYSPDEYVGKTIREVGVPRQEARKWEERIKKAFESGQTHDLEDVFETQQGKQYFNTKFVPERGSDGTIISVQSVARDITERKRAEEEIKSSESRYRMLFDSSNDILVQIDPSGTIVDLNKNAEAIGGYKNEEIVGRKISALAGKFSVRSLALMVANFAKRKLGFQVGPYEVESIGSAGQRLFFEINTVPLKDSAGKETGELAILHDITERKRAADELEAHRKNLEKLVQERTADLTAARAAALNVMQDAELQRLETESALVESKRMGAALKDSEEELRKHAEELEAFNRAMVDREEKIIEMKEEINRLCRELGRPPAYPPIWEEKPGGKTRG